MNHKMESFRVTILLAVGVLLVMACSEKITAHYDFDKSIEIHRLPKYRWAQRSHIESSTNPLMYNELNDKRIKTAVNEQLKQKGYEFSDSAAQVIVHYHIVIDKGTVVRADPLGYHGGLLGSINNPQTYTFEKGTLIIDFMKADTNELIWRGWAESILNEEDLITEDLIDQSTKKIFKSFPESAMKEVTEP